MSRLSRFIKKKSRIPIIISKLDEIHSALLFNSTIIDSEWLKYKNFSPGRWAVDYGLLYTLYRVLSGMRPQHILEFGLGQSSKMLHQYAKFYNVEAITCEHDAEWINFFSKSKEGNYELNILQVELQSISYGGFETLTYKNVPSILGNNQFDLIIVDGPFGSEHYSRSQILKLLDKNIRSSFCIIMDDYERLGERETVLELCKILDNHNVEYCVKEYISEKHHALICSRDLFFLTTL